LRPQLSESLEDEWGGGRGEAPTQSGQDQWVSLVSRWSVLLSFLWILGTIDIQVCSLRVTVPWWRSLRGRSDLQRVAVSPWHIVGDSGTGVDNLLCSPLPSGRGWWCDVSCGFAFVRGFVRVVVSASACHICTNCYSFSAPAFIFLKTTWAWRPNECVLWLFMCQAASCEFLWIILLWHRSWPQQ
jgi:hypothetical protein